MIRGAYGFRLNGVDKITYNNDLSSPLKLGVEIIKFLANFESSWEIGRLVTNIKLVSADGIPTPEEQEEVVKIMTSASGKDWYNLLCNMQGRLDYYINGLYYMVDNVSFLADSLFCEWAYIINLDNDKLEIYRGLNQDMKAQGRYKGKREIDEEFYYGVKLIQAINFEALPQTDEEIKKFCGKIEKEN